MSQKGLRFSVLAVARADAAMVARVSAQEKAPPGGN